MVSLALPKKREDALRRSAFKIQTHHLFSTKRTVRQDLPTPFAKLNTASKIVKKESNNKPTTTSDDDEFIFSQVLRTRKVRKGSARHSRVRRTRVDSYLGHLVDDCVGRMQYLTG